MAKHTANSDYEDNDSEPIRLAPGDEVTVGAADRTWPGWVWASDVAGNDGYIREWKISIFTIWSIYKLFHIYKPFGIIFVIFR